MRQPLSIVSAMVIDRLAFDKHVLKVFKPYMLAYDLRNYPLDRITKKTLKT